LPSLEDFEQLVLTRLPSLQIRQGKKGIAIFSGDKEIAWERPLSKKDMVALANNAPTGDVVAIHVDSVATKHAWIESEPNSCFDSPHFRNYPAVLINLANCDMQVVFELLSEHLG
jgi:hypothetical protein